SSSKHELPLIFDIQIQPIPHTDPNTGSKCEGRVRVDPGVAGDLDRVVRIQKRSIFVDCTGKVGQEEAIFEPFEQWS
ncbi:hypothetical protein AB1L88_26960, partial [Tautonia sp. JC769]|uniref:hypothetical protein n=1 Tax=Tautonia sp. JC769 TaxID=3232135 RepID=UPI0034584263